MSIQDNLTGSDRDDDAPPSLEVIAGDRRRGASEVAESLLAWAEEWGERGLDPEAAGFSIDDVRTALVRLAKSQAALAPVLRIANDLLVELERREGDEERSVRAGIGKVAERWRSRLAAAAESLSLHLRNAIGEADTIMTYSGSGTIRSALEAHATAGGWFKVIVSEGRPGNEGTRMATALAEKGIPVRVGTDAWLLSDGLEEGGIVVVGADALLPMRWVNKIGTGILARSAKDHGIPVVCGADTSKFLPAALAALPRSYDRDPSEIVFEPPDSMEVENPYFEEISYDALDRLVTERGPTRPRDLRVGEIPVAQALR